MGKLINAKTQAGRTYRVDDLEITPLVRKIRVQPPEYRGTILWGAPEAVVIQSSAGEQAVLPIRDQTRTAQLLLLGIGLLGSILIWVALRRQ